MIEFTFILRIIFLSNFYNYLLTFSIYLLIKSIKFYFINKHTLDFIYNHENKPYNARIFKGLACND